MSFLRVIFPPPLYEKKEIKEINQSWKNYTENHLLPYLQKKFLLKKGGVWKMEV